VLFRSDETSTSEQLGKPVGSDAARRKSTFASLLGVRRCEELIAEETQNAITALRCAAFADAGFFADFAMLLAGRDM
jgi:geranylgeranyl diphosphate synthase type II